MWFGVCSHCLVSSVDWQKVIFSFLDWLQHGFLSHKYTGKTWDWGWMWILSRWRMFEFKHTAVCFQKAYEVQESLFVTKRIFNMSFCELWGRNLHLVEDHLQRKRLLSLECRFYFSYLLFSSVIVCTLFYLSYKEENVNVPSHFVISDSCIP